MANPIKMDDLGVTLFLETTNLGWIIQVDFLTISKQPTNQAPEQWMERMSDFESQVSSQIQAVNLEQLMTGWWQLMTGWWFPLPAKMIQIDVYVGKWVETTN